MTASMSISNLTKVIPLLPFETSVLLRGPHGIGKSRICRKIAAIVSTMYNIKPYHVVDRRLSQMSEGDIVGLPWTDGNVTKFNPTDWFNALCEEPGLLLLDEINRATPELMQAAFQIVLDREINGRKLHPKTRIMAGVNVGNSYNVNEMDPALLDRFWTVDITPTVEDFLEWASDKNENPEVAHLKPHGKNLNPLVYDFLFQNSKFLDTPKNTTPSDVVQSRRSWEMLGDALSWSKLDNNIGDSSANSMFRHVCVGYVGEAASISFVDYVKNNANNFTGEQILLDYKNVKRKIFTRDRQETYLAAIEKVKETIVTDPVKYITEETVSNIENFIDDLPSAELKMSLWQNVLQESKGNVTLLQILTRKLSKKILTIVTKDGSISTTATQVKKKV